MSEPRNVQRIDALMGALNFRMENMNKMADAATINILKIQNELQSVSGALEALNHAITQLEIDLLKQLK